jgi:uncharacterized repeat protein (TIGR02543 family)
MKHIKLGKLTATTLLFGVLLTLLPVSPDATKAYATPTPPPYDATEDTFVQQGSPTTDMGNQTTLLLKNAGNNTRATYVEFEYDPSYVWTSSALELVVATNADGASNAGWNRTYTTFNINVYGLNAADWDENTLTYTSAQAESQDFGLDISTTPWRPKGGTLLGSLSVPTSTSTVGTTLSLSNSALTTFLNADTDGKVTFFMTRRDLDVQANFAFASKENTTAGWHGPRLVVPSNSYTYTVAYDNGGGSGNLPSPGIFSSGTPHVVSDATQVTPPAGKNFAGWNTQPDGSGQQFRPGQNYEVPESVTFFAQFSSSPVVTFNSNYGTVQKFFQVVTPNSASLLAQNPFTRSGYSFSGWTTVSDGSGTSYGDGQSITTSSNLVLYANWTASAAPAATAPVAPAATAPAAPAATLATTGPNMAFLSGVSGFTVLLGLLFLAQTYTLRRNSRH